VLPYVCTRLLSYSKRHLRKLLLQWAVWRPMRATQKNFVCAVPRLSEFYSPVVCSWQTRVCDVPGAHQQGSKLVIDKTIAQSRSLFLLWWPALFQGWVHFTPFLFRASNPGCTVSEAHAPPGLDYSYSKRHSMQIVFAVENCAVVGLTVFYSLTLTCRLMFLQLWLLGRSVECILHLHFKLEHW